MIRPATTYAAYTYKVDIKKQYDNIVEYCNTLLSLGLLKSSDSSNLKKTMERLKIRSGNEVNAYTVNVHEYYLFLNKVDLTNMPEPLRVGHQEFVQGIYKN